LGTIATYPLEGTMRALLAFVVGLSLSGCAMSAKGLEKSDLDMSVQSAKSAKDFATCSAETMIGNNQLRSEGDHYWILRFNGYGIPVARWDFKPTHGGSIAELRSTIGINSGDERIRACA
jgi:hypothetical protein